jgi:hypothetical protein
MSEYPGEQLRQLHVRPLVLVVIAVDCGDVWTWIGIGGFFGAKVYDVAAAPPGATFPILWASSVFV